MASIAQIEANRRNAKKSTGPRTTKGKAKSSRNAMKHGLTAQSCLLPGEDASEFAALRHRMLLDLRPNGIMAEVIVERLIELVWRLRRVSAFEASLLAWVSKEQSEVFDTVLDSRNKDAAIQTNDLLNEAKLPSISTGRFLEAAFKHDLTCKLSRYEAHLARQAYVAWAEFRQIQR